MLRDLRTILVPQPIDVLGVGAVDRLLELFRYHQPPTPSHQPGWTTTLDDEQDTSVAADGAPDLAPVVAKKSRAPVLEITGSHSAAGKTSFLYLLAAHALLPTSCGGKASTAVWIDSDGRFSAVRLFQLIQNLTNAGSNPTTGALVQAAMANLHVLTPSTSSQLLSSLEALPDELLRLDTEQPLSLLILDSATAFSQQDRFDAEMARLEAGADFSSRSRTPTRTAQIIAALRAIQEQFECTVLISTCPSPSSHQSNPTSASAAAPRSYHQPQHSAQAPSRDNRPPYEPAALSPWTSFATLTLHIERSSVTQFAPGATLVECLRDRDKRQEAVAAGKFAVSPDWNGSERWPPGVREAVEQLEGRGRFEMRIGREGVELL